MAKGYLAVHLHAHLPYVRHPEHQQFLEERWFFDAIVDTYAPLVSRFEQLHEEGVPFRLSMTLSPTLLEMFADPLLQERFATHLDKQLELCSKELLRTFEDPTFGVIVDMYYQRLYDVARQMARFGRNLANGFRMLADMGHLEIVTCAATHGFLPHMQLVPGAVGRQLRYAVETHERLLERKPDGIWLPECAYYPGLEDQLLKNGLLYFFADTHAFHLGNPRSIRGVYSHVYMPNGVAAFARDHESSKQVWSAQEGYPGDGVYRDFYRDIGFDLPMDYVATHIHDEHTRILTGFKYYRITGETDHKLPYSPALALQRAQEHAQHFIWCREQQASWLSERLDRTPIVVAPYDAELFGHWWFEGPDFLYYMFKAIADNPVVEAIAAKDYLVKHPSAQVVTPNSSSWGDGGYNRVWINGRNEWLYPHLNASGRLLSELAASESVSAPWAGRALRQAERELLLAQSSDWAFIMTTGTSPGYASSRTINHLRDFNHLLDSIRNGVEPQRLSDIENRDNLF
jgi:1,4-alpha-glucan branching enzyme